MRVASRHGQLCVEVSDDGAGGAVAQPLWAGAGRLDRVEAVGGTFGVDSSFAGTRFNARIPSSRRRHGSRPAEITPVG